MMVVSWLMLVVAQICFTHYMYHCGELWNWLRPFYSHHYGRVQLDEDGSLTQGTDEAGPVSIEVDRVHQVQEA